MQMQQPRHKVQHQTLLAGDRLVALLLWPLPFMQRVWPLRFVAFAILAPVVAIIALYRAFSIWFLFLSICLSLFSPRENRSILRSSLSSNHLARYAFLVTSPSLRIQTLPVQSDR
jgi:hypothetical protein